MYLETRKYLTISLLLYTSLILLSFVVSSIPLLVLRFNPLQVFYMMLFGPFRSTYWISELFLKVSPLLLCALSVSAGLKANFWNIGVEGQFCMGAWAAGGIALYFGHLPKHMLLPMMFISGILIATFWGVIPAILKVKLSTSEVITTLLMNYIANLWLNNFIYGKWKGSSGFPYTEKFSESSYLPNLFGERIHLGVLFGVVLSIVLYFLFKRTRFGYKAKVVSEGVKVARYAGINADAIIITTAGISAAIAGLAGVNDVSGVHHRLHPSILLGYGYTGIIISWLSKNNPLWIILVSLLFAILAVGGDIIQVSQVPNAIVKTLQSILLISFLIGNKLLEVIIKLRLERD